MEFEHQPFKEIAESRNFFENRVTANSFFKPLKVPYYISAPAYIGIYKTEGGLEVNPNFQVLRYADDKPIPGLYAVGAGCVVPHLATVKLSPAV